MDPINPLVGKEHFDKTPTKDNTVNHSPHYQFGMHDCIQVSSYLRELRRLKLWPLELQEMSVANIIDKIYCFEDKDLGPSMGFRTHGRHVDCWACTFDPRGKLVRLAKEVDDIAKGLCLDCMLRGSSSTGDLECRVSH
jgi:hypothetical protein